MKMVTGLKFHVQIYLDEMQEAVASTSECPASLPGSALVE